MIAEPFYTPTVFQLAMSVATQTQFAAERDKTIILQGTPTMPSQRDKEIAQITIQLSMENDTLQIAKANNHKKPLTPR